MGSLAGVSAPFGTAPRLVGREREQRLLRDALASALGGRGGLVLVAGEAGIGKTALARGFAREARAQGAAVLLGRAFDLSEPPPYGVWLDLLAGGATGDQSERLGELRAALQPRAGQTGGSQAAIFERVFAGLAGLAGRCPLVCVLDDLHWADPASLDLLRFVARQLANHPILLVGTYRADEIVEQHPLARLLPALVREAEPLRIALPPLDTGAVQQLVRADYALKPEDEDRLLVYLRERTAGNPLYLGELLRTLEEERLLLSEGAATWALADLTGLRVPPLLQQVIAERLAHLGGEAIRWLAVAAVIGQEVPFDLWGAVTGIPEEALQALVERATAARVLDAAPDGLRVQFHHPLIRQALYDSLSPPRRRVIHQQIGDLLGASTHPDLDKVADHLQQAGDPRAVAWLLRAGDRAQRAYAFIAAAERVGAALALLEQRGGDPAECGWRYAQLANLLLHVDPRRATDCAERALALASEDGDQALAAYAQGPLGLLRCRAGNLRDGLMTLAASVEAREALAPDDRERLLAWRIAHGETGPDYHFRGALANWCSTSGHFAEAAALAAPLISLDPTVSEGGFRIVYFALAIVATFLGRADEGALRFAAARTLAHCEGDFFEVGQYTFLEILYLHLPYHADRPGDRERLAAAAQAGYRQAAGVSRADSPPGLERLSLLALAGDWDAAWDLAVAVRASDGLNVTNGQAALGPLALARGETALARELVREVLSDGPATEPGACIFRTGMILLRVAAGVALDEGDCDAARAWLACHDRWLAWNGAVIGRAEGQLGWAAYHRAMGDLPAARCAADRALAHASDPRQPLALLAAHRTLGELDTAEGRRADAQRHLNTALALADACAAPYERALTLLALAELSWSCDRFGESRGALTDARASFEQLGAAPALARADRLAVRLTLVRPQPGKGDGLTDREVDILRLVAAGRSNREVAAALSVSERTVERHLENTYRKIDARNRADAVAYAVRHNLT
jgi:DNA-binding CsgD family transcriptional regulator